MIIKKLTDLKSHPKKIISLVPSQTELLHALGLEDEVVGITKFCIHPKEWYRNKKWVGGTKNIKIKQIQELQPDLIIANKEENDREQIEALAEEFPVWITNIKTLDNAIAMIEDLGTITRKKQKANALVKSIKKAFAEIPKPKRPRKVAYLVWHRPYMTVGGDTFINDMIKQSGFKNAFAGQKRYPKITEKDLQDAGCETILLSSEPFPFGEKHVAALKKELPDIEIHIVDGELFSWYGSRILDSPAYFKDLQKRIYG